MAVRSWARLLGVTLGAGALAGASQLGLAYGLGILRLTRVLDVAARDEWTAQLTWVAWYAMTAAVIGALVGRSRLPERSGSGARVLAAVAAGLGAAVVAPLTMEPARTAQVAGVQPVFVIGVCAGLGALVGVFAAYAALSRAVARWNLIAIGLAVWIVAVASVAPSLVPGKQLPAARLGVFDAVFLADPVMRQRTAVFTLPALALVCGAALGWAARRRAMSTLTVALTGVAGPALPTIAYLIAGPGSGAQMYQVVPYWAAMTATGAGVLGSVLAAVLRRTRTSRPPTAPPDDRPQPTPDRPPLPRRDTQAPSAIAGAAAAPRPPADPPAADPAAPARKGAPSFAGFPRAKSRPQPQAASAPPQAASMPPPRPQPQAASTAPPRPQPQAASAAPPRPQPMTRPPVAPPPVAPPPVAPPAARAGARPPAAPPATRGRGKNRQQTEGEFVDWVSGLGNN